MLTQKRQALPELRIAAQLAVQKFNQSKDLMSDQSKLEELTRELAWAHVREKQQVGFFVGSFNATY